MDRFSYSVEEMSTGYRYLCKYLELEVEQYEVIFTIKHINWPLSVIVLHNLTNYY
jgi:hypothetical protein